LNVQAILEVRREPDENVSTASRVTRRSSHQKVSSGIPQQTDSQMVLTYSYLKPRSTGREWLFRKRLWVETTFAFSMCQRWEKAIGCMLRIYCHDFLGLLKICLIFWTQGACSLSFAHCAFPLHGTSPITCQDTSTTASSSTSSETDSFHSNIIVLNTNARPMSAYAAGRCPF
jgi:hypothetical protein